MNTLVNRSSVTSQNLDLWLVIVVAILCSIGFLAIASASIDYAESRYGWRWYHASKHAAYLLIAIIGACVAYRVPTKLWNLSSWIWLLLAVALLLLVLVPGVGREVNGAQRWIPLGPINLQPSETAKAALILFLASYLQRRQDEIRESWMGFLKPLFIVGGLSILLLFEPDFGATVIVCGTALGMLFLAGVRLSQFFVVATGLVGITIVMVIAAPYRLKRFLSYQDPWADPFDSSFQLTQSLIAFGRGDVTGAGLGQSVQKLFYLPEAHTDFVFSIWAEETGLIGSLLLLALFVLLIGRLLWWSRVALARSLTFESHVFAGIAFMLSGQVFVSMGMSMGLLPTKGLTLPMISFGGSSLIVTLALMGIALRLTKDCQEVTGRRVRS
jgi:cell division protein FtsW